MDNGHKDKTIAYMMSRFPKLSETFILYEILQLERQGLNVELFPLQREHEAVVHSEAAPVVERACFSPFVSRHVVAAQLYWLLHSPRAYLGIWWSAIRGNLRSRKF